MMTSQARYIKEVEVNDPDTGEKVLLSIYKDSNTGKLLGLESSFTTDLCAGEAIDNPYANEQIEIINNNDDSNAFSKSNKFLIELFNVPSDTSSDHLRIQHECIASWNLKKVELKGEEHVAYIETIMRENIAFDSLDGEVSVSATNHEVQGVDLYIKPLEPIPMCLSTSEDALAQSEGWGLFENADGEIQLQRIDDLEVFSKDESAHEFVKNGAALGSLLHLKVKDILLAHSKKEHDLIFA